MNKVILMGRLTADPEMRQTPNGVTVASFRIAVNRRFAKEGQQTADFISCVAWRQTAEFVCRYFRKGNMIAVVGSIQTRDWNDSEGKRRYTTEVVVEEVNFTGEKTSGGAAQGQSGYGAGPYSGANNTYSGAHTYSGGGNYSGGYTGNANTFDNAMPLPDNVPTGNAEPNFGTFGTSGFSTIDDSEDDLPF
jgi:single-strand DNA-binding protein